jgi:hypothetical protein
MSGLLAGCDHGSDLSEFDALTISRTGSFELDMAPVDAFPLFTAPGEALWAPGWEPFILNGDGFEEGTVWVTEGHGHTTYWYVARFNAVDRRAQYVRVTPEANAGTVSVQVVSNGSGGSTVNVTYQLTGLSDAGNKDVGEMLDESEYSGMMKEWRSAIVDSREKIDSHFGR